MPLELLQDSDLSSVTIGPHWPSSYPEYLSPHQDKDEQRRVVWARLLSQRSNLAGRLSETKARYLALRQELNPRTTQVESSHDPLYRDSDDPQLKIQPGAAPLNHAVLCDFHKIVENLVLKYPLYANATCDDAGTALHVA